MSSNKFGKEETKLIRIFQSAFNCKEHHTKIKSSYFKSDDEVYQFFSDPENKEYTINIVAKESDAVQYFNKTYMKSLEDFYTSYKEEKKKNEGKDLLNELNRIANNQIKKYSADQYYKTSPRHNYLLGILNDTFERFLENHREEGNKASAFLRKPEVKQTLIKQIGKDSKYDLNYLRSIYNDLLAGIGIHYDFQDEPVEEKKNIAVQIIILILGIIAAIIVGLIYYYLIPVVIFVFIVAYFRGKRH